MPFVEVDDFRLHYRTDGDPASPCLVMSNSLGTNLSMWDAQAEALAPEFFIVRYDTRGHGQSAGGSSPGSIGQLGQDVLALLDHLGVKCASFCGISMGGLTGQWLGIHAAPRIDKLVLANTAARIGSADAWSARAGQVRTDGMDAVADGAAARWFTPGFVERAPGTVARMVGALRGQGAQGYAACCDALAMADLCDEVRAIPVPTLIVAGEHDPVTTVADGEWLRDRIAGARMATVPASHISNIEAEEAFTTILRGFLAGQARPD
jgi:3-oxoadipate enol-lactonase